MISNRRLKTKNGGKKQEIGDAWLEKKHTIKYTK